MIIEIAANSYGSARIASQAGADRIELCANLELGGTTPSPGQLRCVKNNINIPVHALIRPRGGDFVYSDSEMEEIIESIKYCRSIGVEGVVVGFLTPDGDVDIFKSQEILKHTEGMNLTFHRAFDLALDQEKALEKIIGLGFDRILTSGGKQSTPEGIKKIANLVKLADKRIIIMPGSGINENNIVDIAQFTGAREFHLSGKVVVKSPMEYRTKSVELVHTEDIHPYNYHQSSFDKVKRVVDKVRSLPS